MARNFYAMFCSVPGGRCLNSLRCRYPFALIVGEAERFAMGIIFYRCLSALVEQVRYTHYNKIWLILS